MAHDNKDDKTAMLLRNIPRQLKNKFKAYCASKGSTMTQELIRLMRDCTRRRK